MLVRHFQEVASIDGKTGLLNAAAWQDRAHRVLQRAQRNQGAPPSSSWISTTSSW